MDFEQVRQQLETALELQAPGHGWSVQRDLTDRSHERVLVCSARPSHAVRCKEHDLANTPVDQLVSDILKKFGLAPH